MSYRNYRVRKYVARLDSLHSKYSSVEPFKCAWSMLLIRSPRLPCLSNSTSVRSLRFSFPKRQCRWQVDSPEKSKCRCQFFDEYAPFSFSSMHIHQAARPPGDFIPNCVLLSSPPKTPMASWDRWGDVKVDASACQGFSCGSNGTTLSQHPEGNSEPDPVSVAPPLRSSLNLRPL